MKESIEKKIMGGLAPAVLLIGMITWVAYRQTQRYLETVRWVLIRMMFLPRLMDVFSTMQDI